jgi:F-type H+-transporting ATPase subunit delta
MKKVRVAGRYAAALMTLAREHNVVDGVVEDLDRIQEVLTSSREFRLLVKSPVVPAAKKTAIFKELFGSRLRKETIDFLNLLLEKHREDLLPELIEEFHVRRDLLLGIVGVDVITAVECTPAQGTSLQSQLERFTGKQVRVRYVLDTSLKGGMVLRIGDTVLDDSLKRQLERLKELFVEDVPFVN